MKKEFVQMIENYTDNEALREALVDFCEMRMTIPKVPFTETALKKTFSALDKLSLSVNDKTGYKIESLEQSILNGWRGIFAVKEFKDTIELKEANHVNITKDLEGVDTWEKLISKM